MSTRRKPRRTASPPARRQDGGDASEHFDQGEVRAGAMDGVGQPDGTEAEDGEDDGVAGRGDRDRRHRPPTSG
jgi:hypothetical protein